MQTLINWNSPGIIILLLLLFFGVIVLLVWAIRKFVPGVNPDSGEKIDPEKALEEELDRVLVPFEEVSEDEVASEEVSSEE